ncbi:MULTISPECIES: hypothetical protein [Nocardia]|nr:MULTISPECIES: hypothetical protein [Nocardia]MBF6245044.1 hypothetical protein [Nocardia elegans]MBF6449948.1 hypothetical protein [Nocardia elegans]
MTVTGSAPGPLSEPTPSGPGPRMNPATQIERFHHPTTRTLLSGTGFTTTALEHILETTLSVHVLRQQQVPPRTLPTFIVDELRLQDADGALVRRSRLVTPALATVSLNYVVAVPQSAAASGIDDVRMPIGHGLLTRGLPQHRRLLWAGIRRWPDGRPSASRAYIMTLGRRPVCYIREVFHPAVVPPAHTMGPLPEPALPDDVFEEN